MYNHYIPGANGVFERTVVEERPQILPLSSPRAFEMPSPPPPPLPREVLREPPEGDCSSKDSGMLHVLRRLLPREIDLGDILVLLIVLVLLMDSEQDDLWTVLITAAVVLFF